MVPQRPLEGPFVWLGEELNAAGDWVEEIRPADVAEIEAALALVKQRNPPLHEITRRDFPLSGLAEKIGAVSRSVERGRGFVLLRGLPVERWSEDDLRLVFWGLGTYIGVPVSQSKRGELLGEVRDQGTRLGQPDSRGYRSPERLRFHTDRCDCVALLCVREPISGGQSRIVSSVAVHNEIMRRHPELLPVLYSDFHWSRQGEEAPGEGPWYERPVFGMRQGCFTSQFSQSYIESGQRFPEVPRLTREQQAAVELVAELSERLSYNMQLRRGDIQLLNNHVTYHSRTQYQDHEEAERKRLLFRLWLSTPTGRPLPDGDEVLWGETAAGAIRGGVPPQSGPRHAFSTWAAAGWDEPSGAGRNTED